jgi:predicted transcriptional regulator
MGSPSFAEINPLLLGRAKTLLKSWNESKLLNRAMSINEILEELPKLNAQELEEVSYRAQFLRALREGLKETSEGRLIPHEQVKKELAQWLLE